MGAMITTLIMIVISGEGRRIEVVLVHASLREFAENKGLISFDEFGMNMKRKVVLFLKQRINMSTSIILLNPKRKWCCEVNETLRGNIMFLCTEQGFLARDLCPTTG